MKHDIVPGQISIEVSGKGLNKDVIPPLVELTIITDHIFNDRRCDYQIDLSLFYHDVFIGSYPFRITQVWGQRNHVEIVRFPISPELAKLMENYRQSSNEEDLILSYSLNGRVYQFNQQGGFMGQSELKDVKGSDLRISLPQWKEVIGMTNSILVPISSKVMEKLEKIRKNWNMWTIDSVISRFLDVYGEESFNISQQFLTTFEETKTIRDKLAELTEKSVNYREVRVISPYIDNTGAEYLIKMLKNKVKVKIITRDKDTKKAQTDSIATLKSLGAEVKINTMCHARIIVFDDVAAIVSSADLDGEGLNNQKQAGIFTLDKSVVQDLVTFFDKNWQ